MQWSSVTKWLKVQGQYLLTKEKALFKSATMWFAGTVAVMPDLLSFAQTNYPNVAASFPPALHEPVMRWLALGIFCCRMKSMIKPLPPPVPPPVAEPAKP